jgi:Tfp pilus assembly protein PilN
MIYLKTSIGLELRGEDILLSSLQSNLPPGEFTHFKRIANYQALNKEHLRGEISQFFRLNGLNRDNIVLGIPRKDVILRYFDLPLEVSDNLKQVIQYQVQSFEPTEDDKYYYDYTLLKKDTDLKKLSIMLVMVKKALMDGYLQMLREVGIRPAVVIASSIGLANIFLKNQDDVIDKTFILADLGVSGIELLAVRNGTFAYSREAAREDNQSWKDLVLREIDEAASKMRLGPDDTLEKIVISGESSESAIGEIKTSIPDCELMQNSIGFVIPQENKAHLQESAAALGLAFMGSVNRPPIKMNLLPSELRIRHPRWAYLPAAILILVIIAMGGFLSYYRPIINRRLIAQIDVLIKKGKPAADNVHKLEKQLDALETKIKSLEEVLNKRDMNLEVLKALTNTFPKDTYLSQYSNKDGDIQLIGLTANTSTLIPELVKCPLLTEVQQKGIITPDEQAKRERFTCIAKLRR